MLKLRKKAKYKNSYATLYKVGKLSLKGNKFFLFWVATTDEIIYDALLAPVASCKFTASKLVITSNEIEIFYKC